MASPLKQKGKIPEMTHKVICRFCDSRGEIVLTNPDWLRFKRESGGLSLRSMAKKLHISAVYLSDIELGKRRGNAEIIQFYKSL